MNHDSRPSPNGKVNGNQISQSEIESFYSNGAGAYGQFSDELNVEPEPEQNGKVNGHNRLNSDSEQTGTVHPLDTNSLDTLDPSDTYESVESSSSSSDASTPFDTSDTLKTSDTLESSEPCDSSEPSQTVNAMEELDAFEHGSTMKQAVLKGRPRSGTAKAVNEAVGVTARFLKINRGLNLDTQAQRAVFKAFARHHRRARKHPEGIVIAWGISWWKSAREPWYPSKWDQAKEQAWRAFSDGRIPEAVRDLNDPICQMLACLCRELGRGQEQFIVVQMSAAQWLGIAQATVSDLLAMFCDFGMIRKLVQGVKGRPTTYVWTGD